MLILKRMRKIGRGNLLNIAYTFCVVLFINIALNVYFTYLTNPEAKTLFLEFCFFVLLGLFSFGAVRYFYGREFKYISKSFKRFIIGLLVVLIIVSIFFALLFTSLVIPQIISLFKHCVITISGIKFTSSIFFIYFMSRFEEIFRYTTNDAFINLVTLLSLVLFVFVSLNVRNHKNLTFNIYKETDIEEVDNNYKSLRIEDIESKRFKRRLSFGYIYKVFP